ncbi:hypothetical protein BZA05DRAFT_389400 [Tricharina praecox]|uniref:uncharacterized protein n=1 Tax=Tricharina praecox TaxID=43433 RepID=UPI0022205E18|nr:uncharacterized protein BZA05DRAFT_389400 [Tricharina praecox]KAI5855698.1 hypothetical protein BZA05DRAFT_389400 [Tricharina praecox]
MPPRIPLPSRASPTGFLVSHASPRMTRAYTPPAARAVVHAPTQPPSHRAADARKTQLHRTYLSLLRSSPVMLLFQHNNLRATEWTALRREVVTALSKIAPKGEADEIASNIKINILRGAVFSSAMRVAEFYDPKIDGKQHGTSREAYEFSKRQKKHPLDVLLTGPVGVVTFPAVSPVHLQTVVNIMFPAGRAVKGMDPAAVSGLQKLFLVAARVDGHVAVGSLGVGRVLDSSMVRWVSSLPGLTELRAQLAGMLQTTGGGDLVRSLESIPISIVRTVDAHRKILGGELGGEESKVEGEESKPE